MTLRNDLIKLAHENPELRAQLLPLVGKTAGSNGWDTLRQIADYKELVLVHRSLAGADDQSAGLLRDVMDKLADELEISRGAQEALNRLQWIAKNGKRADSDLLRNNIFKAANSLGIKLPSGMFASQGKPRSSKG